MGKKLSGCVSRRDMESGPLKAVGVWFRSLDSGRYLYLLRNDSKHPGAWGLPGGKIETSETLLGGMERECIEEINYFPENAKLVPLQKFINNTFTYHTFFCEVSEEFIPSLNEEHCGYAWVILNQYPKPMHPGLFSTVNMDVVQDKINKIGRAHV